MILPVIFALSGAGIVLLLLTKVRELQTRRTPMLLRVISLGDARMKEFSHRSAHFYADSKEDIFFFIKKQLPLHTKNTWNKTSAIVEEKLRVLAHDLRDTRLFKKKGGISDYFKLMSEEENRGSAESADESSTEPSTDLEHGFEDTNN